MDLIPVSVTILTKDSARCLRPVLEALRGFDEVVMLDSGSTDATFEIAREFANVKVQRTQFKGFGPLHNEAAALARNDWILSLDSDEVLSGELAAEIGSLRLDETCVYSVPMRNFYNGKWIRWCGWHPDRHVRLYHRKRTRFTDAQVHEEVMTGGLREIPLRAPVLHYPYGCIGDFLVKQQRYSDLFASQNRGRPSSAWKAVRHAAGAFVRAYVFKRGFLGGREGLTISWHKASVTFCKYMKLLEANEKAGTTAVSPGRKAPTPG